MDYEAYEEAFHLTHEKHRHRQRHRHMNSVTCGQGNTALHVATTADNHFYVTRILRSSHEPAALLFKTNFLGETALHIAARLGLREVVKSIMSFAREEEMRGNNAELLVDLLAMENREKDTALHEAVRYNRFEIVKLLIEGNPRLGQMVNAASESPLFIAIDRKFYKVARYIMENCPDFSCSGRNGMTVMHAAVIRLDYIVNYMKPLSYRDVLLTVCVSPISWLLLRIKFILSHIISPVGNLILMGFRQSCIPSNDAQVFVKDLLEKCGAEILQVADDYGWMPLHYAASLGKEEIIKVFLEANRYLAYIKDNEGISVLHIASVNGRHASTRALLIKCPDICELLDKRGQTALHAAARTGQTMAVSNLLWHNVFRHLINQKDHEGNTALHLAAMYEHYATVKRLAQDRRVDKGAVNAEGMTVIDIIQCSTELNKDGKALLIKTLKGKGFYQSLERRPKKVSTEETETKGLKFRKQKDEDKTKKSHGWSPEFTRNMANVNLLVATIIASITFSAAVTAMPGGYDDSDGLAILRTKSSFHKFLVFDSLAFACASASMCIHFLIVVTSRFIHEKYSYPFKSVLALTLISIVSSVLAFVEGTNAVLKHRSETGIAATITLIFFFGPVAVFFIRIAIVVRNRLVLFAEQAR